MRSAPQPRPPALSLPLVDGRTVGVPCKCTCTVMDLAQPGALTSMHVVVGVGTPAPVVGWFHCVADSAAAGGQTRGFCLEPLG